VPDRRHCMDLTIAVGTVSGGGSVTDERGISPSSNGEIMRLVSFCPDVMAYRV